MEKNDEVYMRTIVYITENYSQFKPHIGQPSERAEKNYKTLNSSIAESDGNVMPIIVNEKMEIIDGNTRFKSCRDLKKKLKYQIIHSDDITSLELMRYMNSSSKEWKFFDYIEFYAIGYGKPEFIELLNFTKQRNFGSNIYQATTTVKLTDLKNGILPEIDYQKLSNDLILISRMLNIIKKQSPSVQTIARAMSRIYRSCAIDESRLFYSVERYWSTILLNLGITRISGELELIAVMQKCYNYNRAESNKVRIYNEKL